MFKYQTQPILLRDILKDGWTLYNESIKYVWIWSFFIALMYIIPAALGYIGIYHIDSNKNFHFSWPGFFIFFISLFITTYLIVVVLDIINTIGSDQKVSLQKSFSLAFYKLPMLYLANIIYYIVIVIGTILFLFPAVFLWILFVMFIPLMIFENLGVLESYVTSAKMVWGSWWQTFIALLIPSSITYLLRNVLRLPGWDVATVLGIDIVVMTLVMPYFYTVLMVQYNNLKLRYSMPKAESNLTRLQS